MASRLENLIKSLTPQEKRYFRLHSALQSGEKTYLKLFDELENQTEYDENLIREKYKGEKFVENLSVTKNYLSTQILKSLRTFSKGVSKENEVVDLLEDFEILKKKGLREHAEALLKKAKKITEKYDFNLLHCRILKKEIAFMMQRTGIENSIAQLRKECETKGAEAEKELKLYAFKNSIQVHLRTQKQSTFNLETLKQNWMTIKSQFGNTENLSFRGVMYYFEIERAIALLSKNMEGNYEYSKKIFEHWDKNIHIKSLEEINYLKNAGNYLKSCFFLKKYSESREVIKFLRRTAPKRNFSAEAEFFNIVVFRELFYYLNTLDFGSALDSLNNIESDFKRFDNFISDSKKLTFIYNISILYFLINQTTNASDWLDKILNFPTSDHRQDLQRIALFLNIVFHLDMNMKSGHFSHIPSMIDAILRKLKTREEESGKKQSAELSEFEELILNSCTNYINAPISEKTAVLNAFLRKTQEVRKETPNVLGAEELEIWLKQKLGMKWKPDKF